MQGGADEDPELAQPPESTAMLLDRIAAILGVAPCSFFEPQTDRICDAIDAAERSADLDELLELFRRIADPDLRRSALRLIRVLKDEEAPGP